MARGCDYEKPRFSVPVSNGSADSPWPLGKTIEAEERQRRYPAPCPECERAFVKDPEKNAVLAHTDLRDEGRPRKRVCFGKVVAS